MKVDTQSITIKKSANFLILGKEPLASVGINKDTIDYLFATLLLTQFLIFWAGNLIAQDFTVLRNSTWIALACVGISVVFYMLTQIFGNFSWGLISTYGILLFITYSGLAIRSEIGIAAGCIGFIYTLCSLRVKKQDAPKIILMAVIASVTCFTVVNAYTSFDMMSRLNAGDLKLDTVYHASIAAMIKNYGITSTGLNGLVETPYHALSHALMGGLSLLSNQPVLEVYGVASYVLFAPILILTITLSCAALDSTNELSISRLWGTVAFLLWITPRLLDRWAVWDSYFVSESYMVSLGLLMVALPLLFKREITRPDLAFVLFATFMISEAKATVGIIYAGLWLSRVLFIGKRKYLEFICLILSLVAVSTAVLAAAKAASGGIGLVPFDFLKKYGGGHSISQLDQIFRGEIAFNLRIIKNSIWQILTFFFIHFLFSWIIISATIYQLGKRSILNTPIIIYTGAATFAGILVVFLFEIPGGSLYYISNVAMFIALPSAAALMASIMYRPSMPSLLILSLIFIIESYWSIGLLQNDIARTNHDKKAQKENLISELIAARTTPLDVIYRYRDDHFPAIHTLNCEAYPLIFPAVSEHSWVGVVKPQAGCSFIYYSYEQYGLSPSNQKISMEPRVPIGMKIVDFK